MDSDCQSGMKCLNGACATYVLQGGTCSAMQPCRPDLGCVNGTCGTPSPAGTACKTSAECDQLSGDFCKDSAELWCVPYSGHRFLLSSAELVAMTIEETAGLPRAKRNRGVCPAWFLFAAMKSMNSLTPAALAPGVSSAGMIRSVRISIVRYSDGLKYIG